MPCSKCGQTKNGTPIVFDWYSPDGVKTYSSEADATIAKARAGNVGPIVRRAQPAKA